MTIRRNAREIPIEIKQFTLEETQMGILKLKRRIGEVKNLEAEKVRFDNALVKSVTHNVQDTIREVFGENSPECRAHEHHAIWHGGYNLMDSDHERQRKFEAGIPQTIITLDGLVGRLEEKRADLQFDETGRAWVAFQNLKIHPQIAAVCSDLFRDGHYAPAVFDASKALVNMVKEKSGCCEKDGADLMRTVFSKNNPILAFNNLEDQSGLDEQEGLMHIFEGAVLAIRNPRGHDFPQDNPDRAIEYIGILSLLAFKTDESKKCAK